MSIEEARPMLCKSQALELTRRLFGLIVSKLHPLPSYYDQNFYVVTSTGEEYVLKIMNYVYSQNPDLYEAQNHVMAFLHLHGLPVQTALPNLTGATMALEDIDCGPGIQKYLVRLLTYLPGTIIAMVPCSPQMLYQLGRIVATTDTILQKVEHPKLSALHRDSFLWNLGNVHMLEPYMTELETEDEEHIVRDVMKMFKTQVLVNMTSFRKCLIHADFNEHNILVELDPLNGHRISGLLDFGDMSYGYYIYELAITIMHMMIQSKHPLDVGGPIIAGWESVLPLNEAERDALYVLVMVRLCQSLVMARYTTTLQPENKDYLMISACKGVYHLHTLWKMGKEAVLRKWMEDSQAYSWCAA